CNHCGGILTGHSYMKKTTSKTYSYYRCLKRVQKGETACTGVSLPAQELEDFVIEKLFNLSKNKTFLTDKKKMIELYKLKINENVDFKSETKRIDKQHYELTKRMDILLGKLERELISDDDFQRRYQKLKAELENLEQAKVKIQSLSISRRQALKNLEVSFNEIDNFNNNWDYLDDTGKVLRIRSIVKEVRVEKKKIDIDIFLDVADLSRTDTDSLPQSA
ncbi:MAG: zinc ribbon domain-containing protein, partial [Desulfobacterales bacterium]